MGEQTKGDILESITNAFFALDRQWHFTYVNREAERLLRKKREELIGRNVWVEFPQAVGSAFFNEYHKALAEQVSVAFEAYYPPFDTWFEVHAYPSPDGLAVYFQDIGERKKAEQALRESEARYRSLYGAVEVGIVMQDCGGAIVEANEAAQEILGLTFDQMRGRTPMDPRWQAIHDDGSPFPGEMQPAMVALRTGRRVRDVTMGILRPNGERRWLLVNAAPIVEPDGGRAMLGVVSTFLDITERRQAEEALQRYRLLSSHARDIILFVRRDGRIIEANDAAVQAYQYSREELLALSIYDLRASRSEERRVGKECRSRWSPYH